jgi:ABC-type Fe3+ transport system substrate-binding protein
LFEAFKKRFDIDPEWEWLPLIGPEANARVLSEGKAGQGSADIVYGSYANVVQVDEAGFIPSYDWVGTFGQELPGIKAVVDEAIPEFRGKALPHWDVIYVAMYSKGMIAPDAVPSRIQDFTQPQWKGKFIVPGANHPWQMLGLELGVEPMFGLMKSVLDNQPVIARQPPAAVAAQVAGQAPFGIGYTSALETEMKKGAPIDWKPFSDYVPADALPIYVPSNAPHPNLARLFAAWLVTEGLKIEQDMEYIGRVTDTESAVGKKIKQLAPNAKLLRATNLKDVQTMEGMRGRIGELITAASR